MGPTSSLRTSVSPVLKIQLASAVLGFKGGEAHVKNRKVRNSTYLYQEHEMTRRSGIAPLRCKGFELYSLQN